MSPVEQLFHVHLVGTRFQTQIIPEFVRPTPRFKEGQDAQQLPMPGVRRGRTKAAVRCFCLVVVTSIILEMKSTNLTSRRTRSPFRWPVTRRMARI